MVKRTCAYPGGCEGDARASGAADGLCPKHYQRMRRTKWYPAVSDAVEKVKGYMERAERAAERAEAAASKVPKVVLGGAPPARGNKRKFTSQRQEQYLAHRAAGLLPGEAATAAGVTMVDVQTARRVDPGFYEREKAARELSAEPFIRRQMELALAGDSKALESVLANLTEDWRPANAKVKVEHSGQVDHVLDTGSAIERILALNARLEERRALTAGTVTDPDVIDVEVVEDDA